MIFAQIKDQVIQNTIILDDENSVSLFQIDPLSGEVYDFILRIDSIYPQPGIGWSFDGIVFTAPPAVDDGE